MPSHPGSGHNSHSPKVQPLTDVDQPDHSDPLEQAKGLSQTSIDSTFNTSPKSISPPFSPDNGGAPTGSVPGVNGKG